MEEQNPRKIRKLESAETIPCGAVIRWNFDEGQVPCDGRSVVGNEGVIKTPLSLNCNGGQLLFLAIASQYLLLIGRPYLNAWKQCKLEGKRSGGVAERLRIKCPRDLEEHGSLSAGHGTTSPLSAGLLVDTNLETSIPDTYRAPPAPLPYDVVLRAPQAPSVGRENSSDKIDPEQAADPQPPGETIDEKNVISCEDLKGSDVKNQNDDVSSSPELSEIEVEASKSTDPVVSQTNEEETCPTCFEGSHPHSVCFITSDLIFIIGCLPVSLDLKYSYACSVGPPWCLSVLEVGGTDAC
ncbi:hypothetical protein ACLOJK_015483 [Asimina triloba]